MAGDSGQFASQVGLTDPAGGEYDDVPRLAPPSFPQRQQVQPGQQQAPQRLLVPPPPGGLSKSPEELTRQIGWIALTEVVASSAQALFPDDPKAVALTVAYTLQPYLIPFAPWDAIWASRVFRV